MRTLETEDDKIQKICDQLRKETLEPAEKEAQAIIDAAKARAHEIVEEARIKREELQKKAVEEIEHQTAVFHSAIAQASKQALELLRQEIERKLFNPALEKQIESAARDPLVVARLIQAIVDAITKHGTEADLAIYIPQTVSPKEVVAALSKEVVQKLAASPIEIGTFKAGVKVKLVGKKMTIDVSDETLTEWIARFIQKDLRKFVFLHGS
jgi:V/A-type H+-transporting ATPase subunit E